MLNVNHSNYIKYIIFIVTFLNDKYKIKLLFIKIILKFNDDIEYTIV